MKIPVILDCDPGHDDAIAMIMAHAAPAIEIQGITTVAGNQTVEKTTLNALKMCTFLGLNIPVAKGAAKPLYRDLIIAPEVHGETGLDGPQLPEPAFPAESCSAVQLMAKILTAAEDKVTLVPTGALTNIALLLTLYPELKNKIAKISLMGGAATGGNWTPAAEFNILVDPEAADIVFKSGLPIVMAGLDVTHKAIITKADTERFRQIGTKAAVLTAELLDFFIKFHEDVLPQLGGSPLHDPCAVIHLVRPDLFKAAEYHVQVDTSGELTTGCTIVDRRVSLSKEPNALVLLDIDRKGLVDYIAESLARLD